MYCVYCACDLFNNDVILVKVKITHVHISCSTRLHIYVIRIKRVVMITSNLRPFLLNWKYTVAVKFSIYTSYTPNFFLYFHNKKNLTLFTKTNTYPFYSLFIMSFFAVTINFLFTRDLPFIIFLIMPSLLILCLYFPQK